MLDFGAVARLPDGLPRPLSIMVRLALENRPDDLLALLRREGFVLPGSAMTGRDAIAYLAPFTEPLRSDVFRFNRRWLQRQAGRVGDLRSPDFRTGLELNLPPQYLLVHRVTMGTLGCSASSTPTSRCAASSATGSRGSSATTEPTTRWTSPRASPPDRETRTTQAPSCVVCASRRSSGGRATAPRPRESRGAVVSGQRAREPSR